MRYNNLTGGPDINLCPENEVAFLYLSLGKEREENLLLKFNVFKRISLLNAVLRIKKFKPGISVSHAKLLP
jgi:hypothetical protein